MPASTYLPSTTFSYTTYVRRERERESKGGGLGVNELPRAVVYMLCNSQERERERERVTRCAERAAYLGMKLC